MVSPDVLVALSLLPGRARFRAARGLADLAASGSDVPDPLRVPVLLERLGVECSPADWDGRLASAREHLARAGAAGIQLLGWFDERYPDAWRNLADPPVVLWLHGSPDVLSMPAVAMVGSRAASIAALETAASLASDLARAGVCVVSGLARGIDAAAHRGALETGRTVAVLGSGVDRVYPPEHDALAARIVEAGGAVVSELPPGTSPRPHQFPLRNRLISGLAAAVVVVEASERSGSLITARWALDQGREVMAVPGQVAGGRNRGAHALLRDGARLVERAEDVLEELGWGPAAGVDPTSRPAGGAEDASRLDPLGEQLLPGEAVDLDELSARTGQPGAVLLARLLDLELAGAVARVAGGRFVRTRRKW